MGYLSALFDNHAAYYTWLTDDPYYQRLDVDDRTPLLLAKLRLRDNDESVLQYLIVEALLIPPKWKVFESERPKDRLERRRRLAEVLRSAALALRSDRDISNITVMDHEALIEAYHHADDLQERLERGISADPLPSIKWDRPTRSRHRVLIQGESYPVPTTAEHLSAIATGLLRDDWPDSWDTTELRKNVPSYSGGKNACRNYVAASVFNLLTYGEEAYRRAPNDETAMLVNILLGLTGADEMTGNDVSVVRRNHRDRYLPREP